MGFRALDEFADRMRDRAISIEKSAERHIKRAALIADQVVVTATPVDTGRARANWITSIGAPVFSTQPAPADPNEAARQATGQGQTAIASWRIGAGPIFITNSLPYIKRLDDGYSAQAPEGMTAQAVAAASEYLRRAKLLKG